MLVPVSSEFSGTWVVQKYSVLQCMYDVILKMCVLPTVHKGARWVLLLLLLLIIIIIVITADRNNCDCKHNLFQKLS